jgi:hypothetical protein
MSTPRINVKEVKTLLEEGVSKEEIRETKYSELSEAAWKRALKAMGLSKFKVKKREFILEGMDELKGTVTPTGPNYNPNNISSTETEESPFNV